MTARILYLDIETSPLESMHWGLWKQNISLAQIKVEWSILSFSAWWEGDSAKDVEYMDTWEQDDLRDDTLLLVRLHELLNEADFVVAQNGKRFDLKKIRARMLMAGLPPFSPIVVIDTLLIAKDTFGFTSNKLQWMADKFSPIKKRKHGKFPGFDLWVEYLKRNPAARKEMRLYNIDDTKSLRYVYLALRPWAVGHPNIAALWPDEHMRCPRCGSEALAKRGYHYTNTGQYHRYRCGSCKGWTRSRYTLNTITKRKNSLLT